MMSARIFTTVMLMLFVNIVFARSNQTAVNDAAQLFQNGEIVQLPESHHKGVVFRRSKAQRFSQMKKHSGQYQRTIKTVKKTLEHLGFDNYVLLDQMPENVSNDQLLQAINTAMQSKNQKGNVDYYEIIRRISPHVSYSQLERAVGEGNIPVSRNHWQKIASGKVARKVADHSNKGLSEERKILIRDFWLSEEICRVSPHDTLVTRRKSKNNPVAQFVSVYYRKHTIKHSFHLFKETYPDVDIKRTSFFKYKPKNVKRSKSQFDCCPICKEIHKYKNYLDTMHLTVEEIKAKTAMDFHLSTVADRGYDYKAALNELKPNKCVMIMDFKANISLGKGPEEDSHVFFNAPQRSVFGCVAFFQRETGENVKVTFSIISPVLMHDSITVREMLNNCVLNHSIFNEFGVDTINFWMDNAPNHFRTKETIATFYDIQKDKKFKVIFDFFPEYHGKSECDSHFGILSRLYTNYCSLPDNADINTTEEFLNMYKNQLMDYGSVVVPSVGGNIDELHNLATKKMNIIPVEFNYEGINIQELEEQEKEQRKNGEQRKNKSSFKIARPYTKRTFVESSKSFTINNFYHFEFHTTQKETLIGSLNSRSRKFQTRFKIVEEHKGNYKLKLGIRTAAQPKFSTLKRSFCKYTFHVE